MKIEIEEVLKIIEKKQLRLNYKINCIFNNLRLSHLRGLKRSVRENEESLSDYGDKLSTLRELTAAFAALGEVYASLLAWSMCEAEQEAANC